MQSEIENRLRAIGTRLREERVRLGLDQGAFGEAGGVKPVAQSNYETGKRAPDALYFAGVAEIGADVLYVLTGLRAAPASAVVLPAVESAAKTVYEMVRKQGLEVTPQQFAGMVLTFLPKPEVPNLERVEQRPTMAQPVAGKISGRAQVIHGSGNVQIGGLRGARKKNLDDKS